MSVVNARSEHFSITVIYKDLVLNEFDPGNPGAILALGSLKPGHHPAERVTNSLAH